MIRSSLRGIRRCSKCDNYISNRTKRCKNKKCAGSNTKNKACRIVTSFSSPEYFSVRMRDIGSDYRAFVELSELQNEQRSSEEHVITVSARCSIPLCIKTLKSKLESYSPDTECRCEHIDAAIKCSTTADILDIKQSVLNLLNLNDHMKQEINKLKNDQSSPLVQRVSKTVMVVRSQRTEKQPLGYTHISFQVSKQKRNEVKCKCEYNGANLLKNRQKNVDAACKDMRISKYCVHYYLAISAFASDAKLYEEFKSFVKLELPDYNPALIDINFAQDERLIELPGDVSYSDLPGAVLSPFVSQMIELPDGNGHMIELQAKENSGMSTSSPNADRNKCNLNDLVIYKPNSCTSEVVKTCDVLLANGADDILNTNQGLSLMEPLDIPVMLADNGNLINLSNVIVKNENENIHSHTSQSNENNNNFIKLNNDTEIINIQHVSLKPSTSNDNVYTIASDDTALQVISLEQIDSLFMKSENSSYLSSSDCNNSSSYYLNDIFIENMVEELDNEPSICRESSKKDQDLFDNVAPSTSDNNSFTFGSNLSLNVLQNNNGTSDAKKAKKHKINSNLDHKNSHDIEIIEDNLNYNQILCQELGNNIDVHFENSVQTFFPTNTEVSKIITINTPKDNAIKNTLEPSRNIINLSGPSVVTKYTVNSSLEKTEKGLHLKPVMKRKKSLIVETVTTQQDNRNISDVNFSFIQWLSSVTENINQTMHFQFKGKPDSLVFHVPEIFFQYLHERMSSQEKRRLPNKTTVFVRKESVPLGRFTMHAWHITSIPLLKKIFDTPDISLDVLRFFEQNSDGTFTHIEDIEKHEGSKKIDDNLDVSKTNKYKKIRPGQLVTFLKVGNNTNPKQNELTPFCIEWIPNILPKTKIGELRLKFEFGHKTNYK